jgi:hypothetical protein
MGGWPPAMLGKHNATAKRRLGQKNTPLPQRFAGLPQRFAVRRAFGSQKAEKRREISRHFSRQGYASDLGHVANLSDNARVACGDVRHPQQVLRYGEAFVLL